MQLLYQGMLWRAEDWAVSHNYGVCATCPFFLHQAMTLHRYRHDSLCDLSRTPQNICKTFVQRRPNVFDVGPTLNKCFTNVFRSLG